MKSTDKRRREPDSDPKVCRECGDSKPLTEFNVRNKQGHKFHRCRKCLQRQANERIERQRGYPIRVKEVLPEGQQRCPRCTHVLPTAIFGLRSNGKPQTYCPPCQAEYKRKYQQSHPEQKKATSEKYWQAHGEELKERQKEAYAKNPERFARSSRKWKQSNPESVLAYTHSRRASIKGSAGKWTAAEWRALKARYDWRCVMCGRRAPEIVLCFEHIVSIKQHGPNVISNGQPMDRSCNSKKGYKHVLDLRPGSPYDTRPDLPIGSVDLSMASLPSPEWYQQRSASNGQKRPASNPQRST